MERPSRWDLTEDAAAAAAGGVKWDNSSKDGKFVDVPTLQATPRATPLALHPSVHSLKELQATRLYYTLTLQPSLHSLTELQATALLAPHPSLQPLNAADVHLDALGSAVRYTPHYTPLKLQTFISMLSARPCDGASVIARRVLFLDLHEWGQVEPTLIHPPSLLSRPCHTLVTPLAGGACAHHLVLRYVW